MNLSQNCDLEINGQHCNRPATVLGLSASMPELWGSGSASVASFCTVEHAEQEPRPTREQAEDGWADVADMCGGQQYIPADAADAWQRLLSAYPAPVPFQA
ncbi:hypothetical protein [Streptomyces sp. FL07-04A]|uniref:hypothetical protein n=1 Tax=Streptomyces sp. FL07-04A TaxID=3028658 RepID=UPI0029A28373|nr:hypothetical protein [Streptomyces sp. FL07-04A]MDX3578665.1 hypothetical protein [Streptomyces sp. FL07-04A]